MSTSRFNVREPVDDQEWDQLVEHSPQGTLFSLSAYLRASRFPFERYLFCKGEEVRAGACFSVGEDGNSCSRAGGIYNGLMHLEYEKVKPVKQTQDQFEVTEFFVEWLTARYQTIELLLSPHLSDLRPFLWHNYHSTAATDRFAVDLRYTSYLDISSLQGEEAELESELFWNVETTRRQQIRKARKEQTTVQVGGDAETFVQLYAALMERQGVMLDAYEIERMGLHVRDLISSGIAQLFFVHDVEGELIYATLFGWDTKRAYYLFGVPGEGKGRSYQGTMGCWEAFLWLARQGVTEVDMEGVNSPNRGWFKLSFGGELLPYHWMKKGPAVV